MKDLTDELVVSEMAKMARDQYEADLDDLPQETREAIEDEAIALVEDLLEVEYERDLESRLGR